MEGSNLPINNHNMHTTRPVPMEKTGDTERTANQVRRLEHAVREGRINPRLVAELLATLEHANV